MVSLIIDGEKFPLYHKYGNIYDGGNLLWEKSPTAISKACKEQGFEIVKTGGMRSCYSISLKKVMPNG